MLKMNLRYLSLLFEFFFVKFVGFQQNVKISQNNAFDQMYDLIRGIMRVKEGVTSNETVQQFWVSHLRRIKRLEWSKSDAYYWNKEQMYNNWQIIVNSTTTCITMNCYCYYRTFVSLHIWKWRQVFASSVVYDEWRRGSNIYEGLSKSS